MQLISDDVIISGCNSSLLRHVRRQMRCDGSRWTGEFVNCSTLARQSQHLYSTSDLRIYDLADRTAAQYHRCTSQGGWGLQPP